MILSPGYEQQDQWQVQIQAQIQLKADVLVKSDFLSDEDIRSAHMTPIDDLQDALGKVLQNAGPDATICVLPQGPQTIAYIN
jgi:nickel-dependent lactate racemase